MSRVLVMPRGINVGTRNRVSMAELRTVLQDAGFEDVATILQSGNIIATRPGVPPEKVGAEVTELIEEHFGISVPSLVRSAEELRRIAALNPLAEMANDGSKYLVTFLSITPSPEDAEELMRGDHGAEVVHIDGSEVYVWTPEGIRAMVWSYAALEKRFGCVATARNWNTLEKILAKL